MPSSDVAISAMDGDWACVRSNHRTSSVADSGMASSWYCGSTVAVAKLSADETMPTPKAGVTPVFFAIAKNSVWAITLAKKKPVAKTPLPKATHNVEMAISARPVTQRFSRFWLLFSAVDETELSSDVVDKGGECLTESIGEEWGLEAESVLLTRSFSDFDHFDKSKRRLLVDEATKDTSVGDKGKENERLLIQASTSWVAMAARAKVASTSSEWRINSKEVFKN
jgi:hypothetical protein